MPSPEYSHLLASPPTSETDGVELFPLEDSAWHSTTSTTRFKSAWLSESTAWRFLTLSLIFSLVVSAVNLTFLSAWSTTSPRFNEPASTTSQPLEYPSVYIGLERVTRDPTRCLSRGAFPDTFYTYDARKQSSAMLRRVHAPEDGVTFVFGGPFRAVIETYMLDYGLENCTFIVHSSNTTHPGQGRSVDVFLTSQLGHGQNGVFLDRLAFTPGKDSVSRPFHCPSRSRIRFELRCDEDDCAVQIPLQGVTSKSNCPSSCFWDYTIDQLTLLEHTAASSASIVRTGFRINQYEAVDCIGQ